MQCQLTQKPITSEAEFDTTSEETMETVSTDGEKQGVRFGTVRIHTHPITLGDNPAVKHGLPMELGWDHVNSETFDLEEFEQMEGGREKKALIVKNTDRLAWLKKKGHSRGSFLRVCKDVQRIQISRNETNRDPENMIPFVKAPKNNGKVKINDATLKQNEGDANGSAVESAMKKSEELRRDRSNNQLEKDKLFMKWLKRK